ncbi:MAG TPA: NADH-quinone oxidoreductase subunit N [Gammaproteobacteria bacterium]|nr:NADH-quinone oxidoreductase subunit N [Gammaproteobacteria bacterium]
MTGTELFALLPLIVITLAAIVVMLTVAFHREHSLTFVLTLAGFALSFAAAFIVLPATPTQVTPLLIIDRYAIFYMALIFASGFAVAALCYGYLVERPGEHDELYMLLLMAVLGAVVLVASAHLASFFLGLELLSVSLFAMIAYPRRYAQPLEAGIKYLILSGVSSSFLLFGMALVYAQQGHLDFAGIARTLARSQDLSDVYLMAGSALIVAGVGFKLSVVPFHMWTPDVYQGAPAPITGFLATISKGAVFAVLLRYFVQADGYSFGPLLTVLGLISLVSMIAGNLLALLQNNVKRILAYSSIAHLGYLLVAFLAAGPMAVEAVSFYLLAYFVTTLGAFAVVTLCSLHDQETDTDDLENYRGLFWRQPWLAGAFTAMLLSLAGIPLTAGFLAKFYAFAAGIDAALWLLVVVLVVTSMIGLYYYLRIIVALYSAPAETADMEPQAASSALTGGIILAALTLLLIWLGVYPTPFIDLISAIAADIT